MTEPSPSYRVLVGITGCIAAYKACEVVRGLQRAGCQVKVVMTEHATRFVDPVTFRALTHEKVAVGLFDDPSDPIHHISLAEWCDLFLIVPCTANVVAKLACGLADDLLSTTALACPAPLMVAPAMNMNMYAAPAFQDNLAALRRRGVLVVDADEGYQACGDVGRGRLPEPDAIVARALEALADPPAADATRVLAPQDLAGLSVVITAGPTVEPIDAVRFVSNHSSGKMGYALAAGAAARGARVTLISGPVALDAPEGVQVVPVRTAREMLEAAEEACLGANIAVFAAAVADYRPAHPADRKLKKGADDAALDHIELVRNPDILATIAAAKRPGQVVVGFAAETDDVVENARKKLASKHADLIVANCVGDGVAFGQDDDQATLVTAAGDEELPLMPKAELADVILTRAKELGR
ncbi:MAG: bifunctional phosphopantothenoylcysteine decarboxylase/phosphopantothenate--cysteine ligase CoaBC [Eggerthellaceae bacterium]|nr:bifunctional phosphopantothenoylcysteine decarboxylase/phosphopantothenate--cysteine ligase CoaBC [Eggerthellaceae bacterium]